MIGIDWDTLNINTDSSSFSIIEVVVGIASVASSTFGMFALLFFFAVFVTAILENGLRNRNCLFVCLQNRELILNYCSTFGGQHV